MATKSESTSNRHPLKRVRTENENSRSHKPPSTKIDSAKKFRRQSSEDSAFSEIEKSADERAFDLFLREYLGKFRPYFRHRSTVRRMIEHLWTNMSQQSKVAFVKRALKSSAHSYLSKIDLNLNSDESLSNDENDFQMKSVVSSKASRTEPKLKVDQKYNRTSINEILAFARENLSVRHVDPNSSSSNKNEVRRSSRVRRAPTKCVCSSCSISRSSSRINSSSSSTTTIHEPNQRSFHAVVFHFLELDEQLVDSSTQRPTLKPSENLFNSVDEHSFDDSHLQSNSSQMIDSLSTTDCSTTSLFPSTSVETENGSSSPSLDFLLDSNGPSNKSRTAETPINETLVEHEQTRRTFVILTELDEPFFGPYPIEFTITI